jgi:hypothetical protein
MDVPKIGTPGSPDVWIKKRLVHLGKEDMPKGTKPKNRIVFITGTEE